MTRILTPDDIKACRGHVVAIDTETTGLRWWENRIIGVGIHCPQVGVTGYMPTCTYREAPYGKPKRRKVWMGKMSYDKSKRGRRVLEEVVEQPTRSEAVPAPHLIAQALDAVDEIAKDGRTTLVGHNLKFDAHFLDLPLWQMPCTIVDTSVLVHLIDSRLPKSLEKAEEHFLGNTSKRQHVEVGKSEKKLMPWHWQPDHLAAYCTNDCVVTYQLAEILTPQVRSLGLLKLFSLEMAAIRLLQKIEFRGLLLDTAFCRQAIEAFEHNISVLERELYDTVGYEFNWRSNAQLSKAIYDDLGIRKPLNPYTAEQMLKKRTVMGIKESYSEYCTSAALLERTQHPLAHLIFGLREADKLRTYAAGYMEMMDSEGATHTSFNPTGTRTGRLSSSKPNLQNVAAEYRMRAGATEGLRKEEYNLRRAFIARKGYKLVSIDYSQQEMRMLAILAQEPDMLQALERREDLHMAIALKVWGDCGEELNQLHRKWSKTIGFGLVYGMTVAALQHKLEMTPDRAREIVDEYWATFPGLRPWLEKIAGEVERKGYIRYWSGRIWREDDPSFSYKGANAMIQGGCADFVKVTLLRAEKLLAENGWGGIVSIVHDEVIFELREEVVEEAAPRLMEVLEGTDILGYPFAVDCKIGDSYGEMVKLPLQEKVPL